MKTVILILVNVAFVVVSSEFLNPTWTSYKAQYSKQYRHSLDEMNRMRIFLENKAKIDRHNELYNKGLVNFTLALNKFADLTNEEFRDMMNGYRVSSNRYTTSHETYVKSENVDVPSSIDWRSKGYVTGVKDQGQCGSCWAFSATGSLEGQYFAKYRHLVSLSEQNLLDCSWQYGNTGCQGGLMDNAFQYVIENGGIDTEQSYPYTAADGNCRYNPAYKGAECVGYTDIPSGDESSLKSAVGTIGPVSIAIDASLMSFQFYYSGIYYDPSCSSTMLDHGVLAVGYGTENGQDFWIVKNSWGASWGDNGFIKMARNRNNHCGIATMASYPHIK